MDGATIALVVVAALIVTCVGGCAIFAKLYKIPIPQDVRDKGYKEIPKG